VIAAVLIVQCFLFQDGGLTALGANFINMGLVGAVGGYAVYAPIRRAIGGRRGVLIGSMIAAWFSVLLAAGAFTIELTVAGGDHDFFRILSWMALVHAVIGVGEALITGLVVRFLLLTRPDLIEGEPEHESADEPPARRTPGWASTILCGVGIALGIAVFASPFACEDPDGLEFVGGKLGFLPGDESPPVLSAPMPDYQVPVALPQFGVDHVKLATAVAGLTGTLAVFAFAWLLARVFSRDGTTPGKVELDAV
jgi:cobalt/nickel transport system permease protein